MYDEIQKEMINFAGVNKNKVELKTFRTWTE